VPPIAAVTASWVFQTLAIFFLVGGYAAARSWHGGYRSWLRRRMARLSRPALALAAVWAPLAAGLYLGGVSGPALHTVLTLVLDPLWFLGAYAVLTALTPLAVALVRRFGVLAATFPLVIVAAADAVRFDLGGPSWAGWVNVVAGWMVPCLLGVAWARRAFPGRSGPAALAAGPAGWAGRNTAARMAPAAAARPATRQPTDRPCRNAFVAAAWITWPAVTTSLVPARTASWVPATDPAPTDSATGSSRTPVSSGP
jgi:Acyltransferase family